MKGKLLIVADCAAATGFAQVSHNLIQRLYTEWDIHVLAINYTGDPHHITQYAKLYNPSARSQGDLYGLTRIESLQYDLKPDIVFHINDPWVISGYLRATKDAPGKKVFYTPVDGTNIKPMYAQPLNKFNHGIAYTMFGEEVLRAGGYTGPMSVIPHGVDRQVFYPISKAEARAKGAPTGTDISDWYIVQVVDRNSQRKRLDLALYGFARWVKETNKPDNVKFYYHGALQDEGYDLVQLADYWGVADRIMVTATNLNPHDGVDLEFMKYIYSLADVKVGLGNEGWGLTTMESMRCGVSNLVLDTAAYSEWARGGVEYIAPADIPFANIRGLNTIHQQPNIDSYIAGLEKLYNDKVYRTTLAQTGYELVSQDKYSWDTISKQFDMVFEEVLNDGSEDNNRANNRAFTW
jgi:glycosyltransferase involved in cell wall biosynthesis